jgi:proline racemase
MQKIKLYNAHCCGEIGDVVIGLEKINYNSPKEASIALFKDKKWRNFFLNEPRGGVFKHCNIIVKPSDPIADAGFVIMEPEDNPPMSGSNSICVSTVLLEKNFLKMNYPLTQLSLEAPGGIIKVIAECEDNKVKNVSISNLPSFIDKLEVELKTKNYGKIIVSTAYGGDSFLLCDAQDFNLKIVPDNAKSFVDIARELLKEANDQIGFQHPTIPNLNYISFCQFMEPIYTNEKGEKIAKNTVVIRPGKLDRSPCGTGTSARLALLRKKNQIDINEKIISQSIIDSTFECFIENEIDENSKKMILPNIKGSAFITGEQVLYLDDKDPFPQGYRLNDTWPL